MSVIKITKERTDELLSFLDHERKLYEECAHSMLDDSCENKEYTEAYLKNFDDTIAIVKSVFEAWN